MKSLLAVSFVIINLLPFCLSCEIRKDLAGTISNTTSVIGTTCWIIEVPDGNYTRLNIEKFTSPVACIYAKLEITVIGSETSNNLCPNGPKPMPITVLSDVNITLVSKTRYTTSFTLDYFTESQACGQRNHFRCSNHSCVTEDKVCNGEKDCLNGADEEGCDTGIKTIKGINGSRENGIKGLISKRSESFGWGSDTHRAIIALYLANESYFRSDDIEKNLTMKQMQLQTAVILLSNFNDTSSVNDLSMFIGALAATCHNPREFYGYDLLQILSDQLSSNPAAIPGAYLTLCSADWPVSETQTRSLMKMLSESLPQPTITDSDAVAVMALTCIKKRTKVFDSINAEDAKIYNDTINKIISKQAKDGSFGEPYTTAIVTQALLSAAKEINISWNLRLTIGYLMNYLNSAVNDVRFNSVTLPILNDKTYTDLAAVKCDKFRPQDAELVYVLGKVVGQMRVRYSLYIGDQSNTIYSNNFKVPESSSVYDVMKIAQMSDPKYKFLIEDASGIMQIYEIGGIKNDPESGTYWFIYTKDADDKDVLQTESPDQIKLKGIKHFILWYKTFTI